MRINRKYMLLALALALTAVTCVVVLLWMFPSDVVTTHYRDLKAATEGDVIARGWLPSILPASTVNIRTSNNLDLNTSEGSFSFSTSDYPTFSERTGLFSPPARFVDLVDLMRSKGFDVLSFNSTEDHSFWIFFCKPQVGYCEYAMDSKTP
ncbi:hypothetical protein Q9Q94_15510 [Uliginosibacterium sp. 31-16]|uniref:hypothetical protein n=1 Tax=Uliginosibacterium sp. 31-16 TaxID=3068315 RepID=UPI00273F2D35|nr:hypothetical protein [Uliginosibacterium sp. 31-16]MDP5240949.1 hypothetical protein [Uliginosibacterium sp. 31-16]